MSDKEVLIKKLQDKSARIGILGMGYVGMPLAVVFAQAGFNVLGIDPDRRKVDSFDKGTSYIQDVSSELIAGLHTVAVRLGLLQRRQQPAELPLGHREDEPFLGREHVHQANYSEEGASVIDSEVAKLLSAAHDRAKRILVEYRATLDRLADALVERETLDETDLAVIFSDIAPAPAT